MTPFAFYGTLMEGGRLASALAPYGSHGDYCVIPGQLWDLGAFPALTLQEGRVAGQLWHPFPGEHGEQMAIQRVDGIEGEGYLYTRQKVRLIEPEDQEAWVYVWLSPNAGAARVRSGNWRVRA